MLNFIGKNIVLFGWLLCLLCITFAAFAVPSVVGATYHPNAPYAPYAPAMAIGSLAFVLVSAALAIRITVKRKAGDRTRLAKEFGALLLVALISILTVRLVISPVPESFVQYAGDVPYRIPSVYTEQRNNQPGERSAVSITYCQNSWKGYYESVFSDCDIAYVTLSKRPITSDFRVYYELDRRLEVARDGYRITDKARLAQQTKVVPGDGWIGYTTSNGRDAQFPGANHVILDTDDRIVLFGHCVNAYPVCHIWSWTPKGVLKFKYDRGQQFQFKGWKERERKILGLLDSWQKAS